MKSKNGTFFHKESCLDGHYIISGYTNDKFCNDCLQVTDIREELHRYLRHEQGFQAVFFLDALNVLYCYDQESYDILQNNPTNLQAENTRTTTESQDSNSIVQDGPFGRRRRRYLQREDTVQENRVENRQTPQGSLNMGRMSIATAWQQIISVMRNPELRCALVLNNINSIQHELRTPELSMLEELSSHHELNHSIVIYLFRDTTISNILDSSNHGSGYWATYVETTLRRRIEAEEPENNRVILLGTPNRYEIRNLLNYMRLKEEQALPVKPGDIELLSEILEGSCARQKWSLANLMTRLDVFSTANVGTQLTVNNWRAFTGETRFKSPMDELQDLVGMENVKKSIEDWYALKMVTENSRRTQGRVSSRFAPRVAADHREGHALNVKLVGNPGTGKTTLAKLIGQLYYELGLLPQGHTVIRTANDLISPYVGETPRLVRESVQQAMGGVLFIDEAYGLITDSHGHEAINQLVNDMSAYQGQFAVIIAGYPQHIEEIMNANDGLARRFGTEYVLEDYTASQLQQIFRLMVQSDPANLRISESLEEHLEDFFEAWVGGATRHWGNAGEVENLVALMKKACGARIVNEGTQDAGLILTEQDIPEKLQHCLVPRSKDVEAAIADIEKLIGLGNVKKFLKDLVNAIRMEAVEKAPGNYMFIGAPGTGKTTIARKIGEILGHLQILRRKTNNVVEVKAADLMGAEPDKLIKNLQEYVDNARGGILFIDEAHQLAQSSAGQAIIRALIPLVEDPEIHADTAFILAGYPAEMRELFNVDSGLERRFPVNNRIRFNDYTADELVEILREMVTLRGEKATEDYFIRARVALGHYMENRPLNFGNGGFIRDVFLPGSIKARTERLNRSVLTSDREIVSEEEVSKLSEADKHTLTAMDMPAQFVKLAGPLGMRPDKVRSAETMLEELVGKDEVVEFVHRRDQKEEEQVFYDPNNSGSLHVSFAGPTGSGRHTAARAVAMAWREYGYLEKDMPVFVSKSSLEGQYVGETNVITRNWIEQALDGTLVVEYPSSMLAKGGHDLSYGPEALGTIIGAMDTYRANLSVMFIDTKEGMEKVMTAFPALRSLLAERFVFEDLSPSEMEKVFDQKVSSNMVFTPEVQELKSDFFVNWVSDRGGLGESVRSWGNGAELEQLIECLTNAWLKNNGETVVDTVMEAASSYTLRRRLITREMFPKKYAQYMTRTSAVADTAMQELNAITGLAGVKRSVGAIERRMRRMNKSNVTPGCYCFLGNPGTGKTTVARLMGGILKSTGVLSQGHVISRTAREMCEQLEMFDEIIKLARNGILFIDEAHQLAQYQSHGNTVIKRLLTVLEDVEVVKDTCIILAGYPREMLALLDMDEGLKSRFGTSSSMILFEDYTVEELMKIMQEMADKANTIPQIGSDETLLLTPEFTAQSYRVFATILSRKDPNYGNARFVRNYLHDAIDEMLLRIDEEFGADTEPGENALRTLTGEDVPSKYKSLLNEKFAEARVSYQELNTAQGEEITAENYQRKVDELSEMTVYLRLYKNGSPVGTGTGTIISRQGHILTCAHVARDIDSAQARVYCKGGIGGDYRWFDCEVCRPIYNDFDMAILKMDGFNFKTMPLRPFDAAVDSSEETLLLGYPLGGMLNGKKDDTLKISHFKGRIASLQNVAGIDRFYVDTKGLHGNSGSPVISMKDGRMIGVFSGSIAPKREGNLDELNYFFPLSYFWKNCVLDADLSGVGAEENIEAAPTTHNKDEE